MNKSNIKLSPHFFLSVADALRIIWVTSLGYKLGNPAWPQVPVSLENWWRDPSEPGGGDPKVLAWGVEGCCRDKDHGRAWKTGSSTNGGISVPEQADGGLLMWRPSCLSQIPARRQLFGVPAGLGTRKPGLVLSLAAQRAFGRPAWGHRWELSMAIRVSLWFYASHFRQSENKRTYGETQWLCSGLLGKKNVWFSGSLRIILTGLAEGWLLLHELWHLPQTVSIQLLVTFLIFQIITILQSVAVIDSYFSFCWIKNVSDFVLWEERFIHCWKRGHFESCWATRIKSHIFNIQTLWCFWWFTNIPSPEVIA